jgi:hypothetical protein
MSLFVHNRYHFSARLLTRISHQGPRRKLTCQVRARIRVRFGLSRLRETRGIAALFRGFRGIGSSRRWLEDGMRIGRLICAGVLRSRRARSVLRANWPPIRLRPEHLHEFYFRGSDKLDEPVVISGFSTILRYMRATLLSGSRLTTSFHCSTAFSGCPSII